MVKKFTIILVLALFLSGCTVIDGSKEYDEIVELALTTPQVGTVKTGGSYTYTLPVNAKVVEKDVYSTIIERTDIIFNINVNVANYLIEESIITKNSEGEYIVTLAEKEDENLSEYTGITFETRRILFSDTSAESSEANQSEALGVLNELNSSPYDRDSNEFISLFSNLSQQYSDDSRSANNGGKLKPLTASEMSSQYFEAVKELEPNTYTTTLVKTGDDYQIIYLDKVNYPEEIKVDFETIVDESTLYYSYKGDGIELYVIEYKNLFNVIAKNSHANVATVVQENNISDAVYYTVSLLNSININEEIAVHNLVSGGTHAKPELINLSEGNQKIETVIQATYKYNFSSSFQDDSEIDTQDLYSFNSRTLSEEEIQKLECEELNRELEKKGAELISCDDEKPKVIE